MRKTSTSTSASRATAKKNILMAPLTGTGGSGRSTRQPQQKKPAGAAVVGELGGKMDAMKLEDFAQSSSSTSNLPPLPTFSSLTSNDTATSSSSNTRRATSNARTISREASPMPPAGVPQPLPNVNFGFEDLREKMNRFTIRFDEFIEKGRRRLLVEKNEFARTVAEDKESARSMKQQIEYYKEKEKELQEQTQRELEEALEAQRTITAMTRKKQTKLDHRDHLTTQLATIDTSIATKRALHTKQRAALSALSSHNAPELAFWEDHLCMRIESAGMTDHLRIVFTHIAEKDWEKEYSFVVDMTTRNYRVAQVKPAAVGRGGWVDKAVERLNESRNFAGFLKEMRMGFVEASEAGR